MIKGNEKLIATLTHECRNALSCMFQFGNILMGGLAGELSEEQREYVGIMIDNASRIRRLLDNLTEGAPAELSESADKNKPLPRKAN
jgi:nitrogen-specific signal transduction histidine kinase